jgi:hypothetical protein
MDRLVRLVRRWPQLGLEAGSAKSTPPADARWTHA